VFFIFVTVDKKINSITCVQHVVNSALETLRDALYKSTTTTNRCFFHQSLKYTSFPGARE